jgi:hypothetical protein
MTKIKPWGSLFTTDTAGFILNDCQRDKILSPWSKLVAELSHTCQKIWPTRLKRLYLRGSVPRGLAIPYLSDVDSFAILSGEITEQDHDRSQQISQKINQRYLFCKKVELILLNEAIFTDPNSIWPGIIQTRSLQIAGNSQLLNLPRFKPGYSLLNYAQTWEKDRENTLARLINLSPHSLQFSAHVKQRCAWIMRRMVRTGFELVMERDRSYTPDLYYCYERFSVYFPAQQANMKKALELAIEPSSNRPGLIIFLRCFGDWLTTQIQTELW